ncbi:MAG: hypothetical protein QM737_22920 [Ferruginibacter sp.]
MIFIFFLAVNLFYENTFANAQFNKINGSGFNLTVALDRSVSYKLYDSITLFSNKHYFKPDIEIDTVTRMYTLRWKGLSQNNYLLKVKTVFGDRKVYNFCLQNDTSFVVANRYDMVDADKIEILNYRNSDCIKLYYKSDGCFHDYKETFLIERKQDNNYLCTYIRDSIAEKDTMGRRMILLIPVPQTKYIDAGVIDSLFEMIRISAYQQSMVKQKCPECVSTTHRKLFVLSGNLLFQFYDFGICDWNLYREFVKRYFPD